MPDPYELQFEYRNKRFRDARRGLDYFSKTLEKGFTKGAKIVEREMLFTLEGVAEALARRHGNPWPTGTTKNTMSRRSGGMIQSIRDSVKVKGGTKIDNVEGQIGGPGYLKVHEDGGTIRVKRAKYLTIPLPAALNPDGTPIKTSAREWDKTFVARSKKGNLLIFRRVGSGIVPLYALKRSVKIPPRLGMGDTLQAAVPFFVDRVFDKMLTEMVGN